MSKRGRAKDDGTCAQCRLAYQKGDYVVWTQPVHVHCHCGQPAPFTQIPHAPTLEFTRLQALDALAEAVKTAATVNGVTDTLEKKWLWYEKLKARALALQSVPTSEAQAEARASFRVALKQLIEIAYP